MRPRLGARLAVALAIGLLCSGYRWHLGQTTRMANDFGAAWYSARALLSGDDPYAVVGPHEAFRRQWPQVYPMPAILASVPLAPLSEQGAAAAFAGLGVATLAFALTRARWGPLAGLMSAASWKAVQVAQWSPLVTASAVLPPLGWLLAAKPTVGAALLVAYPNRRTVAACAAVLTLSIVVRPDWPLAWWANTRTLTHMIAPITVVPFGPLVLLALTRWRRPEARLLVALACVPQTTMTYETTALLLVPGNAIEALLLVVCSHIAQAQEPWSGAFRTFDAWTAAQAPTLVVWMYLPAVALVLLRPNVAPERAELAPALPARRAA